MLPSEPRTSTNQIKPLPQRPRLPNPTDTQDRERWTNLFARTCSSEAAAADLAYGCVDWYLYGGEPLRSVGY
jgi:hypothetical protein